MDRQPPVEEIWQGMLSGKSPVQRQRRMLKLIPSSPRCKICNAPFGGVGRPIMALLGRAPSRKNPRFCSWCEVKLMALGGGAEVELTLLFADVRGSTTLAERIGASEFGALMNRFYDVTMHVLVDSDAWIDKLVGDEVIAFYFPFLEDHPSHAVWAARELLKATGHGDPSGPWIPVGVGIHTGTAFVGVVGSEDIARDITALGDAVNTAARLVAAAAAGEILVSDATYAALAPAPGELERRELVLKGKAEPVGVRVMRVGGA